MTSLSKLFELGGATVGPSALIIAPFGPAYTAPGADPTKASKAVEDAQDPKKLSKVLKRLGK